MKKYQLEELRNYDASSVLFNAVNKRSSKVFDKWLKENYPGEVFDEKRLEISGNLFFTVVKYKGRTAFERSSEDCLRFNFRSSIFGDKID